MTLDHEAMGPSVLAPYRRNLLASASDPILNDAAMRTLNAFQPLARKVNYGRLA